jgi:hypothetical protein
MRIMLAADPEAARASFEEDKKAAMERYETGQRDNAQKDFVRFTEMSRTYKALKNKDTGSATRLRQKLEAAKTSLFNNKYWPAKAALDSATDVLIHPQTGTVLTANQGMDFGKEGKMVVTGVNMKAGTVTMRRHADTAGGRPVTMPMSELGDAKPFAFDAAAEASEVGKVWEAQAAEKLSSLSKWDDVKALPSAVLEANHDLIQRQIKDGAKSYKFTMPYGNVPMVDKATGAIKMVESYEHTKMHDTHDYLLPTDGAKEKAVQAWIDERRNATLTTEYVQRKSGRGSRSGGSDRLARRSYKGASYSNKNMNPVQSLLKEMSGTTAYGITPELEKKAKAQLKAEQIQRIRRTDSANEAIEALLPLAKVNGVRASNDGMGGYASDGSNTATYPKDALAMAWARARHLGQLDAVVHGGGHSDYAFAGGKGDTVHAALIRMARGSGHNDLAEAFAETGERHRASKNDAATLRALASHYSPSARTLGHIRKVAGRMGLLDQTIGQLREHKLGGPFQANTGYGYNYAYTGAAQAQGKKLGDLIDEYMPAATARAATKEAA